MYGISLRAALIGAVIVLGAAAIGVHAYFFAGTPAVPVHKIVTVENAQGNPSIQVTGEIAYWQGRIRAVGGVAAHNEFMSSEELFSRQAASTTGTELLHLEAHTFGEALYNTESLSGVSVCGGEYGDGCLHAFLGLAVQEYGVEASVTKLAALCTAEKTTYMQINCKHGLGHGILAYLGYNPDDLSQALEACSRIEQPSDIMFGCSGGAFMEYDIRFLTATGGNAQSTVRPFSEDAKYSSCDSVSAAYKSACMFWQPMWWYGGISAKDPLAKFTQMGAYCGALSSTSAAEEKSCFDGIGYIIPQHVSNPAVVAKSCAISQDVPNRVTCWDYALSQISATADTPANTALVCAGLSAAEGKSCATQIANAPKNMQEPAFTEFE